MTQFTPEKMSIAACAALLISSAPAYAGGLGDMVAEPAPVAPLIAPLQTNNDYYVSVFAGSNAVSDIDTNYDFFDNDYTVAFDTGFVAGVTFGKRISETLRVEGELSFASAEAANYSAISSAGYVFADSVTAEGNLDATYLLVNVWYDIPTAGPLGYYVGGGLGGAKVDGDITFNGFAFGYGPGETKLAGQIGAGLMYDVSQSLTLDVGYRFKHVGDVDFEDSDGTGVYTGGTVQSHSLQAGLMYNF
ncbi:Outer membrane protein beta-barrel domain-containing protein [Yoonia tamlensis]|uniref:Outer membrane protein beta-barrel domain-containing protein n=1 Tax=Yoonia tamlensis TaxID=390270 RepID=A0A1I6GZU4_9RHOB|nr:outer membrane beta-barrel protein [Yoonia tamlensis]SFR47692.1 Outer membrane protein beta-barrel domain-containing protein [Yoonia tamlensis]